MDIQEEDRKSTKNSLKKKMSHNHLFINDAFSETHFHPVDHDQMESVVDFLKNYSFF